MHNYSKNFRLNVDLNIIAKERLYSRFRNYFWL